MPAIEWIPTSRRRSRLSEVKCENPTVTQDVKNGVSLPSSNPFLVSDEPTSSPVVSPSSLDGDDVVENEGDDAAAGGDQRSETCDKVNDESSVVEVVKTSDST